MSIWVGKDTRLLVQGLTGREGSFHALASRDYGTQVVAGVTPGKGGTTHEGIPVFDSVADAAAKTGANASMIFGPKKIWASLKRRPMTREFLKSRRICSGVALVTTSKSFGLSLSSRSRS